MEMLERATVAISHDPRMVNAARYAHEFGLDVIDVLRTDTERHRLMRSAAMMVVGRDAEAEAAKSKSKGGRRG